MVEMLAVVRQGDKRVHNSTYITKVCNAPSTHIYIYLFTCIYTHTHITKVCTPHTEKDRIRLDILCGKEVKVVP